MTPFRIQHWWPALYVLLACAAQPGDAQLFGAPGTSLSHFKIKQGADGCTVGNKARFELAPNPESSASSPSYLLTMREPGQQSTCPLDVAVPVKSGDVDAHTSYREWTIGGALIPFKYYKSGDRSVAGNTSVVGYLGMKWHQPAGDLIFAAGAGPATIGVPAPAGSTDTKDLQATGFTYALMLLGQLGYESTTQFGLAVGHDRVSSNLNWVNNGKTWVGIQIGAKIF